MKYPDEMRGRETDVPFHGVMGMSEELPGASVAGNGALRFIATAEFRH
jgi:hypothetical protein